MPSLNAKLASFSAAFLLATLLHADPSVVDADADLPQPVDLSVADDLLASSPFTRIVNLEETLQLTGIAYVDGKPVATFLNRATQQHLTVSEEPNALGWKIVEAIPGHDLQDTEVHVMIAGEEITLHYGDAQLTPGAAKKGVPGTYASGSRSSAGSNDGNRIKTSSLLGQNGRELYGSLSNEARDKLKEIVHAHLDKHPEQSMEQHSAYAQKIYSKIKAADQKPASTSASNTRNPRGEKPSRKN